MTRDTYVTERCSEITDGLEYAIEKSGDDPRLGAYLAGYITVLISGVVEDCIEHLVIQRAANTNDEQIRSFVQKAIDRRFRNPRSNDIATVLGMFSPDYRAEFQNAISDESSSALGSIVSNRLSLAHRGSIIQQLTVRDVQNYFEKIIPILITVEDILLYGSVKQ